MADGTIVLVSDLHVGGSTALMPPTFVTKDGQVVNASGAQTWLWECWMDVCQRVKAYSRNGPVFVIIAGDVVEGNHHFTMEILTQDETAHSDLAEEVLTPLLQHATGCAFVAGTSAHVGGLAKLERLVAMHFANRGLVRPGGNGWVHDTFKRTVFGTRINVAHHTRGGKEKRLRLSALFATVQRHSMEALRMDVPVADFVVRAHVHHYTDTGDTYRARGVTTPCWQLPTEYVNRIAPDELPDIGAVVIRGREITPILYQYLREDRGYPEIELEATKRETKAKAAIRQH